MTPSFLRGPNDFHTPGFAARPGDGQSEPIDSVLMEEEGQAETEGFYVPWLLPQTTPATTKANQLVHFQTSGLGGRGCA
jgi:hypothetical protein